MTPDCFIPRIKDVPRWISAFLSSKGVHVTCRHIFFPYLIHCPWKISIASVYLIMSMRFLTRQILWPVLKQTTLNYSKFIQDLALKERLKSTSSKLVSFKVMATALFMPSLGTRSVLTENVGALVWNRALISGKFSKEKIYLFMRVKKYCW